MTKTDFIARLREPAERIERRAVWWWMLRGLIGPGSVLAALATVAALWEPARPWLVAPIIACGIALVVFAFVAPWWRYSVHRWEITEHATYARLGWVQREWRVAPTSRVQTVDTLRGPLEQLLGLATLKVTTASSSGSIEIPGLSADVAQEAALRLAAVAEITPGDAT